MKLTNKIITALIKEKIYPENNFIPLDKAFIDERGKIQNLITNGGIESIALITTKKGSVRSNHYHLHNAHYLYLISGQVIYVECDLDGSNKKELIYSAGDMIFTQPKKIHKVVALEDGVMISMAPKSNAPEDHDFDTIKMEI